MKILHVLSAPAAGGAEIYIKDLSRALVAQGHSVYIGFLGHAVDIGRSDIFERQFLHELDSGGVSYFFIGNEARKKPWLGAWRVRRFVIEKKVDIYHTHLPYGILFSVLLRVPCVYTRHSVIPKGNRFTYACFNRFVDAYVGISTICSQKLSEYSRRKVTTIFNGADIRKFEKKIEIKKLDHTTFRCIAVGRILPVKNYQLLIDAVFLLPQDLRSKIEIHIAGEGPEKLVQSLQIKIVEKGLEKNIKLLGNRCDIPDLLAQSQLFVMCSSTEGLPIALIEASLSGLPCVVTNVGGCAEVVEICQNGIVVEPGNPQALADSIAKIATDQKLWLEYSTNALLYSGAFSIENSCSDHLRLYRNLLKSLPHGLDGKFNSRF